MKTPNFFSAISAPPRSLREEFWKNVLWLFKCYSVLVPILIIFIFNSCLKQQRGLTIEHGILTAGVEIGYPPMEYYDKDGVTPIGFDIELTQAIALKMGLKFKFIDTAWEGILAGVNTDKYDMALNITVTEERLKAYNFTIPYISNSMTIVMRGDSKIKIDKPDDIAGLKAGYQTDTTAQYFALRLLEQNVKFTQFSYDKIINCFDDLRYGRIDCIIVDSLAAHEYAGAKDGAFSVAWQGPSDETIAMCLKKGNNALTEAVNDAITECVDDGTLERISEKYFGGE